MTPAKDPPRVLVADDDLVSRSFFAAALAEIGCTAEPVADGASALRAAASTDFALMLLDCRMPDIGGSALLAALRAAGATAPAIATSAEIAADADALHAAGFTGLLEKPTTVAMLRETIGSILALPELARPVLDDHAALSALGTRETIRSLRTLLAVELEELQIALRRDDALAQPRKLAERLHRLRASCGFCGATALAEAAARLDQALTSERTDATTELDRFAQVCATTLRALSV